MSSFKPAGTESSSISVTNPYGYSCVSTSIVFGSFDIANPNKFRVSNLYFFVKIDISSDGGCRATTYLGQLAKKIGKPPSAILTNGRESLTPTFCLLVSLPRLLDVIRSFVENLPYTLHSRVLGSFTPCSAKRHSRGSSERPMEFTHVSSSEIPHRVANPLKDVIQYVSVLTEKFLALGRHVIDLLTFGFHGANVALIL